MSALSQNPDAATPSTPTPRRDAFSSRRVFILAAIGSAVGLGNIWRFPYVAYQGGGGAFMIPYLVALLLAGIPFLFFDYSLGHQFRGGPPLTFRRISKKLEWLGWWQVGICVIIATYYAAIIAWAGRYIFFSIDKAWGDDPETFFMSGFLKIADGAGVSMEFVPSVLMPLVIVWVVIIGIMALGVDKGIGLFSAIFIPILIVTFGGLVVQSVFLPGAGAGLDAFFSPHWEALLDYKVWMSAIGQIFFSLSVGFGIMITYSSYVDRKTDMTGSGLVVAFANGSFELAAGIGVFAALGFMAASSGVAVQEVVSSGIGLAFIAYPTIISQAPGGAILGVLFFLSLVIAGATSMVSILEVGVSALREKLGLGRVVGTLVVCGPIAIASCFFLGSRTGLYVLDTLDAFVNSFGILAVALVSMIMLTYGFRMLPTLRDHLNGVSSFKVGRIWAALIGGIIPLALLGLLVRDLLTQLAEPYEGYPQAFVNVFGWGMVVLLIALAWVVAALPWSDTADLEHRPEQAATGPNQEA